MVLEARGLVKQFNGVRAVDGIDLSFPEGRCFGLLGPNGAGKTTTVEMLEGVLEPSSGQVLYRGRPLDQEFRKRSGIQFQNTALPDHLRVREAIDLFRGFYDKGRDPAELLRACSLEELVDRDVKKLSGGQRQRLLLALALVNDPDVVFLDEPTTGLDPQARRNFWDLVRKIKAEGKTVVLTTHYMEEAYALCEEIAILDKGRVIARGAPDKLLREQFAGALVEIDAAAVAPALRKNLGSSVFEKDGRLEIPCATPEEVVKMLTSAGVALASLRVRSQTLEDLFLVLTGKDLRA